MKKRLFKRGLHRFKKNRSVIEWVEVKKDGSYILPPTDITVLVFAGMSYSNLPHISESFLYTSDSGLLMWEGYDFDEITHWAEIENSYVYPPGYDM